MSGSDPKRTLNLPTKARVLFVTLGSLAFSACSSFGMLGGSGTVLYSSTGAPVAKATVTLDCRQGRFHGSETVKSLSTETDDQGRFSFSAFDLVPCDFAYVEPHKKGFFSTAGYDPRYAYTSYSKIPEHIYLTPEGEERLQRLKYYAAISQASSPNAKSNYLYIYGDFISAKQLAKTDVEIQLVKDSFCARLIALDDQLSDSQRAELAKFQAGFPPVRVDHGLHVRSYCAG